MWRDLTTRMSLVNPVGAYYLEGRRDARQQARSDFAPGGHYPTARAGPRAPLSCRAILRGGHAIGPAEKNSSRLGFT